MKLPIVSDIHGNWPALRAVMEAEPDADRTLCLGDLVNYGPQPTECVAWAQPRPGTPQAAYAVWNDGEVTLRRVPYDIKETLRAYRDLDLNPDSATALRAILLFGAELSAHLIKCSLET
jgi:hypothetical protein